LTWSQHAHSDVLSPWWWPRSLPWWPWLKWKRDRRAREARHGRFLEAAGVGRLDRFADHRRADPSRAHRGRLGPADRGQGARVRHRDARRDPRQSRDHQVAVPVRHDVRRRAPRIGARGARRPHPRSSDVPLALGVAMPRHSGPAVGRMCGPTAGDLRQVVLCVVARRRPPGPAVVRAPRLCVLANPASSRPPAAGRVAEVDRGVPVPAPHRARWNVSTEVPSPWRPVRVRLLVVVLVPHTRNVHEAAAHAAAVAVCLRLTVPDRTGGVRGDAAVIMPVEAGVVTILDRASIAVITRAAVVADIVAVTGSITAVIHHHIMAPISAIGTGSTRMGTTTVICVRRAIVITTIEATAAATTMVGPTIARTTIHGGMTTAATM